MTSNLEFPELVSKPSRAGFEEDNLDATIANDQEGGYAFTRPRHTRNLRSYRVPYALMSNDDKQALSDFNDLTRRNAIDFKWIHPITAVELQVRFIEPPTFRVSGFSDDRGVTWDCEFVVVEV